MLSNSQFLSTICLVLLVLSQFCFGQVDSLPPAPFALFSNKSTPDSLHTLTHHDSALQWYDMFANIPNDWVRWSEATFTTKNIPLFIGLSVSTAALIAADDAIWKASDKWYKGSRTVEKISDVCEFFGDGKFQFGIAAAFGVYGFAGNDSRALRTASQTVEVILACGTVVQVLKHITGRESPFVASAPGGRWQWFPNQIEYHKRVPYYDAYPSGHVATLLATVTVVAENYNEVGWIRPVGYTMVGLLAVAMGNTGIHWYSDYPLSIALGYSFGMLVAHREEIDPPNTEGQTSAKLSFAPMVSPSGTGVRMSLHF